ncbi:MAG: GNAT family N-acetyltransferase [Dokdonella sp.]
MQARDGDAAAPVRIRPAGDADASALAALAGQLGYATDATGIPGRLRAMRSGDRGEVLVAEQYAVVVGWIALSIPVTLTHDDQAEIVRLIVDVESRSRGIGAALVGAAEQWSRDRGGALLRLRSNVLREYAHRFYHRERYLRLKTQLVFGKTLVAPKR